MILHCAYASIRPEQHSYYAGDDQVGALHLRAAVCADRSGAGSRRMAGLEHAAVDRCVHDFTAHGGYVVQSIGGCRD